MLVEVICNRVLRSLVGLSFLLVGVFANAANPYLDWKTVETDHFLIHYPDTLTHLVDEVASESERAHELLVPYMQWSPKKKTQVVMVDDFDSPNGSATPIPNNTMMLIMQPPSSGALVDYDSWLRLLIFHEYTHILHMDKVLEWPQHLRHVFGRFLLLFPNALHPNWFQEGFATHLETSDGLGIGRGQSDLYQIMMRQEVITGLKPLQKVNNVLSREWPVNHAYLYGVYYMRFIRDTYGDAALRQMITDYSDNVIPFRIDSNPAGATGKNLTQLWMEFEQYLHKTFAPQIERIQSQAITHTNPLVKEGFTYGSPRVDQQNAIWFSGRDGYNGASLYRYRDGKLETISELNSAGDLDLSLDNDVVLSQLEVCDNRYMYFDLYVIPAEELYQDKPKLKRLTECGRYVYVRWYQKQFVAVTYEGAIPKLVMLNEQGDSVKTMWQGQSGDVLGKFDVNTKGDLVAAVKFKGSSWNLYSSNISKKVEWEPITNNANIQSAPHFKETAKGNKLYYVESAKGQSEAMRVDWSRALNSKGTFVPQPVTNLLTGIEEVVPLGDRQLVLSEYTDSGYRITTAFENDELSPWTNSPSQSFDDFKVVENKSAPRDYSAFPSVLPTWWIPVAASDTNTSEIGFLTMGNDAAGFHSYSAQLTHEQTFNYLLPNVSYSYDGRLLLNYTSKLSSLQSSVSGVEVANYQKDQSIAYMHPMLSLEEQVYGFGAYINSVTEVVTDSDEVTVRFGTADGHRQKKLYDDWFALGVIRNTLDTDVFQGDANSGSLWQFSVESAAIADNDFSDGEVSIIDGRWYTPLFHNHSIAQRFVVGIGNDKAPDFTLGGTFSDGYFMPTVNLNKRDYALRGYEEGLLELQGDNMALYSLEYRLPFEWNEYTLMKPPIGTLGWSMRFFAEAGSVWDEGENLDKTFSSAGAEWILDDTIAYYLPIRFRIGAAHGFEKSGQDSIYLQIGGAF